jgi:hypothetical protein
MVRSYVCTTWPRWRTEEPQISKAGCRLLFQWIYEEQIIVPEGAVQKRQVLVLDDLWRADAAGGALSDHVKRNIDEALGEKDCGPRPISR